MASDKPKVLHEVAGRSLLGHALASLLASGADKVVVVIGPGREDVAGEARRLAPGASVVTQAQRLGTAHAVLAARAALAEGYDDVLVAFADTPLVEATTFSRLREALAQGAAVAALGFVARDPAGYGRLIVENGALTAIVEHKDADEAVRAIDFCNGGLMALDGGRALELLDAIRPNNAQGEFYLTDAVAIACDRGLRCVALGVDEDEIMGVNDRAQLAAAEGLMQRRLRERAMRGGATLVAPDTVFLSHDTRIGRDVVVEPNVVFGLGVAVEDDAVIHAFSHLHGARVHAGAHVGPFARLRPGADIGPGARIGNFVEVKNASVETGAKVSHLSYIGDARIGAGANIGAGVITCNYDGFLKFRTDIGTGAFIGSNTALVAPVSVGARAYVGSGSVVTKDVAADALAVARGRQVEKAGWAAAFRAKQKPKGKG